MAPSETRTLRKVLIIDDHPLFCDALSMTLGRIIDADNIAVAHTLQDGLNTLQSGFTPDVISLDLNLPDVAGIDGLARLRMEVADIPIIVISSLHENAVIASALHEGVAGYVTKDTPKETIIKAFSTVMSGGSFVPDDYVAPHNDKSLKEVTGSVSQIASLTRQQARILQLICKGKLNKQIAFELTISENTVKAHVTAILRKLDVQSRTQAVLIAQKTKFETIQKIEL